MPRLRFSVCLYRLELIKWKIWRCVAARGGGGGSMVGSDRLNVPAIDDSSH